MSSASYTNTTSEHNNTTTIEAVVIDVVFIVCVVVTTAGGLRSNFGGKNLSHTSNVLFAPKYSKSK